MGCLRAHEYNRYSQSTHFSLLRHLSWRTARVLVMQRFYTLPEEAVQTDGIVSPYPPTP